MVTPVSSVQPVTVEKWSTEVPFTVMVGLFAALFWFAIIISIFGAIYGFFLALVFFIGHVMFVSHIRGNGIKIGPNQFPELHKKIAELAAKFGMKKVPEAYLIQAGGALNAMATKMLNANMLILYTDLLEACENDTAARDMILAHELGHIHAGHLKWHWFLAPGMVMIFAMPSLIGKLGQKKDPFANLLLHQGDPTRKYPPLLPGSDLDVFVQFIEAEKKSPKAYPVDQQDVEGRWKNANPDKSFPVEATSGLALEYHVLGDLYYVYGKGPDGESYTEDDGLYSGPIK